MANFFIADTHLGHGNILKYCHRPFLNDEERHWLAQGRDFRVSAESVARMDDAIIDAINAAVRPEDVLWHLGDFAFAPPEQARRYRDRIACGTAYLMWGNHDRPEVRDLFTDCFQQLRITIEGQRIFLNHYPMMSWHGSHKGTWMLHGHVHGVIRRNPLARPLYDSLPILDVGVDGPDGPGSAHAFRPWSFEEVREHFRGGATPDGGP